jgi:hypothetical protein
MKSTPARFAALFFSVLILTLAGRGSPRLAVEDAVPPPSVAVSISPGYTALVVGHSLQFSATVGGTTNTAVWWQVDGIIGGNSTLGTVSTSGLFTAPSTVPLPAIVNITAVSQTAPTATATATLTLETQASTGTIYYVSTTGSDTNSGSFTAPWRTLQHAANSVHAGDTVYARAGVYNEVVTIPASGSSFAGYITFSSYPRELATVDGTGLAVPNGQWGLFTIQNQSYIVITGFEVRNFSTSSTAEVPIGIYIFGAGSHLHVINNHIHIIANTAKGCNANAFGLTVYGTQAPATISGLAISGNEVDHLTTGCSETLSVNGNVTNFAINNNRIHDDNNIGIDVIGYEGVSPQVAYDRARYGTIRGNRIYNITSFGNPAYGNQYAADGIYVDGGTHIVVEQNLIHNVDIGIEMASEHSNKYTTYITARNNVIYAGNSVGISIGGYASGVGGTQNCNIVNNTLFGNDTKNTGSGEFQIQYHDSSNTFENNVLYATAQGLLLNGYTKNALTPATIDYNLYYSTVGASNAQWIYQGTTYTGYSTYLTKTGNDQHSPAFSDPKFVSRTAPLNLDLQSGSPAINAGTNLGASIVGAVDFNGNPRVLAGQINLGAYEH